jgi:5-methylthioadenosine/S-adenosylhomocysteine deaminase
MGEVVDTLFVHAHLFTMTGDGVGYIADGAVAVRGDTIVAAGATTELEQQFAAREVIDAGGHAVLPGLIDAHMHTPYAIMRGVAQDVAHWMQRGVAVYSRNLLPAAALAGTHLNVLEALKTGTTTMGDYATPHDGWADIFAEVGVRAVLTPMINALPRGGMANWRVGELYPLDEEEGDRHIQAAVAFAREWHNAENGRITVMYGPQAPDMLDREQLLYVKRLAAADDLRIHMHVAQGDREIDQMLKRYGKRTPDFLDQIGYLDDQLVAVHLTEATEEETAMIAYSGASMVLCSGSIGIIDGIVPPAHHFRLSGGRVALGSDQAAGNNTNNMFNEMKLTALFNKIKYRDPTVLPAWDVLRMATIEGAQALGLGHQIGSLEPGKQADIIMVDLRALNLVPVLTDPIRNIVPNLVYAATGKEVDLVMVAGRVILRDGRVLTADEEEVRAMAQAMGEEVAAAVERDPQHRELALLDAMDKGWL